jgi:hypothetical protein
LIDQDWQNDYHEAAAAIGGGNKLYVVFQNQGVAPNTTPLPGATSFDIWFMQARSGAPSVHDQALPTETLVQPTSTPEATATPQAGTVSPAATVIPGASEASNLPGQAPIPPVTAGLAACVLSLALVIVVYRNLHAR